MLPVAAGLTLLLGFVAPGEPCTTPYRLTSFEQRDDHVRQAALWIGQWIGQQGFVEIGDPTSCIEAAKEQEAERVKSW